MSGRPPIPPHTLSRMMLAVLLLASVIAATTAQAGPPFVTDDPETPPLHGWEINIPITLERESGEKVLETPLFDINFSRASVGLDSRAGASGSEHGKPGAAGRAAGPPPPS